MSSLLMIKLATQLLLPPGVLLLLAFTGLVARRRWWGRMLLILSLAALWLLSIAPVRDALTRPLEFASPALQASQINDLNQMAAGSTAIVLLGGGMDEQAPEYGGENGLKNSALSRTVYAAGLARQTALPVYATGGKPLSKADESEGTVMRRWLMRFGVAEEQVYAEQASENTWQNASYMKAILHAKGISHVVLVTSARHMPRAIWCFKKHGMRVLAAPTDYLTWRKPYDARSFLPDAGVLADSSRALHEYLGIAWYRLRYR